MLRTRRTASFAIAALGVGAAIALTGCKRDTTLSVQTTQPQRADLQTVSVPVDGMICMVCAGSVKNALKAVHGVRNADVNLEKHYATVQYEHGKVSVEQFTRAINRLGYKAGVPTPVPSQ